MNLTLAQSGNCVIVYTDATNQDTTYAITETKLCVSVVTLSFQDNAKLLQQLKSGFTRKINWNKYQSKPELLAKKQNLHLLVESSFQGINRISVLAFEDAAQRTSNKIYYLPNVGLKDYNVMIAGKIFFYQPVKNNRITYENI